MEAVSCRGGRVRIPLGRSLGGRWCAVGPFLGKQRGGAGWPWLDLKGEPIFAAPAFLLGRGEDALRCVTHGCRGPALPDSTPAPQQGCRRDLGRPWTGSGTAAERDLARSVRRRRADGRAHLEVSDRTREGTAPKACKKDERLDPRSADPRGSFRRLAAARVCPLQGAGCWTGEIAGVRLEIHSTVIGKAIREGGWDQAAGAPRTVRSLLPAGSAWCRTLGRRNRPADSTGGPYGLTLRVWLCGQRGTANLGRGLDVHGRCRSEWQVREKMHG